MQTNANSYRQAFVNRHAILPVIHVTSTKQALWNACLARKAGCDGVFLINHGMTAESLLEIHHIVHKALPGWWIGVNCLDLRPAEVFERVDATVAGVWVDDARIQEEGELQSEAEAIRAARKRSGWQGLYFGGVAFKYCRHVHDLERAASIASAYMDVVTTSGPGTGQAASPTKLLRMRKGLGTAPLAIASGVTPHNVQHYLGAVDCLLVATGISNSFDELASDKVEDLVRTVRGFPAARS